VANEAFTERQSSLLDLNHLVDAPARRIHLHAQLPIGGASVQAEATVDALGIVIPLGLLTRPVAARRRNRAPFPFHLHRHPPSRPRILRRGAYHLKLGLNLAAELSLV